MYLCETIYLCKELKIITCNPKPQAIEEIQLFSTNWFSFDWTLIIEKKSEIKYKYI